jgi:murein L,D-transpeptidase YcbB/YkuD
LLLLAFSACKKKAGPPHVSESEKAKYKKEVRGLAIDSVEMAENPDSMLVAFYRLNNFETVWNQPEIRKAVIYALGRSGIEDGLNPKNYAVDRLAYDETHFALLTAKGRIAHDILMTRAMRKYLRHLSRGRINPLSVYRNWDLKRRSLPINDLLSGGIAGDSIAEVIDIARPSSIVYKRLVAALGIIDSFPDDGNPKPMDTLHKIVRGDTAEIVPDIRKRLIFWRDMPPTESASKIYDHETARGIRAFQTRHGLYPDGVIGVSTIKALNYTKAERRGQILANLERWRWFPKDMGDHYVLINIPEYQLSVVKNGDTVQQRKIVVGKKSRRSPVLSSTFSNIVLNPTWTVPPTIIREDLTPDATKDRSYFARKNITIYERSGKVVPPANWNPARAKSYRYIQKPGDDNSLGNVKFNFPNRFTVYLHDTNHRDLFVMRYRSYSSGCTRVEDPLPLAAYMLNDSIRWPLDSIKKVVSTAKTTTIRLKQKINIHQFYWTAWSEGGKLIFRTDIYNIDPPLAAALRH